MQSTGENLLQDLDNYANHNGKRERGISTTFLRAGSEDGTKVESIANRMVTFPSNMKHKGTSCTDERTRVVINFNYFK